MTYREKRDKFLSTLSNYELRNPELIDMFGNTFIILFENDNMNDRSEVDKLIRTAMREDYNFIILFENPLILEYPFKNHLLYHILTNARQELDPIILTFFSKDDKYHIIQIEVTDTENEVKFVRIQPNTN